jgi:hypothetical protein
MGFGTGGQPRDFCGDGVIALRRGATNIFALIVQLVELLQKIVPTFSKLSLLNFTWWRKLRPGS